MLTIAKEHITIGYRENGNPLTGPVNPLAEIHLYGQEVNPETWAVSKSDLYMKDPTGKDAENVVFGTTLSNDRHAASTFDYLIANPPYGKDWKRDESAIRAEHQRGAQAGLARGFLASVDGQLLFLLHMIARRQGSKGGRLSHRHHHERVSPSSPATRAAARARYVVTSSRTTCWSIDIPAGATLLQHWHCHLRLASHQPQGREAPRQGATHRRLLLLDTDAPEPGRQAASDTAGQGARHPQNPERLPGRRHFG